MGVRVIIHGFIECPFDFGRWDQSRRVFENNRSVIAALPKADQGGFLVARAMFAVHPPKGLVPHYDANLITFGGAYKNMYRFESDWICEFEQLLARLCWHQASVFNEFVRSPRHLAGRRCIRSCLCRSAIATTEMVDDVLPAL